MEHNETQLCIEERGYLGFIQGLKACYSSRFLKHHGLGAKRARCVQQQNEHVAWGAGHTKQFQRRAGSYDAGLDDAVSQACDAALLY